MLRHTYVNRRLRRNRAYALVRKLETDFSRDLVSHGRLKITAVNSVKAFVLDYRASFARDYDESWDAKRRVRVALGDRGFPAEAGQKHLQRRVWS